MKALITGSNGQLGHALRACVPEGVTVVGRDVEHLDITDRASVRAAMEEVRPGIVLNCAAYTAVDRAESDEEVAHRVNALAVGILSEEARAMGARFLHVSTDFVFDGMASSPYAPDAEPNPLSVYGRTKLEGERLAGEDALIVRTAWVYGPIGHNFVRTMLRLMGALSKVRVVADQIGTPTYAPGLAAALWALAWQGARGIHHYTDAGVASWYDFAVAIQEEALAIGLLVDAVPVVPIATRDFPTPAVRPPYSVLDKRGTYAALGGPAPHWRVQLRTMLKEIQAHG